LRSARATLERTRRSYERFSRLFNQDTISREELDQVETEYQTAQAEVSRLEARVGLIREQLEDTRIKAPMAGILSESLFDPGDYVEEGEPLVTLYDTSTLEVAFRVSGSRSNAIQTGQPVRVTVDAHPDRTFPGQVLFVGPAIDPATRTFLVKARMENPSGLLTPGAFASVEVVVAERSGQPAVPEESLVPVRGGYLVFTVDDNGTARRQGVETGLREPGLVEITQGVSLDDLVVTRGHMNLSDGDRVEIESTRDSAAPENHSGSKQDEAARQ
ncbi:MAG: efflux RND transporter periplasmic adaptor subunit, partial [Desulfohalobiaceae bacterium]